MGTPFMRLAVSRTAAVLVSLLTLGAASPAAAQSQGDGYLFGRPDITFSIRGGYSHANASSDLFDQVVTDLTLKKGDFSGLTAGAELGFTVTDRLSLSVDLGYARTSKSSWFRDFVDNNDRNIEQTTEFERMPLMLNARVYLTPTGRSVGRLAWIPSHIVPWVGAGAGFMRYRFHQYGDFIDFQTTNVFRGDFNTQEWTSAFQGLAGVDVSISPRVAVTGDARYLWAKAPVGRDFSGFDRIDLSGVSATLGLTYRM
jgi:opacity protein-like surface antigen